MNEQIWYPFLITAACESSLRSYVCEFTRYNASPQMGVSDVADFYAWHHSAHPNVKVTITGMFPMSPVNELPEIAEGPKDIEIPKKSEIVMLRELMGYVQNGTDEIITIFQDDATMAFYLKCSNGSKELWCERGHSLEDVIRKSHDLHVPPEGE